MAAYHLQIVTPDRLVYDGQAERLIVRTGDGDMGILPRHIDYAAPLGMGEAKVTDRGRARAQRGLHRRHARRAQPGPRRGHHL